MTTKEILKMFNDVTKRINAVDKKLDIHFGKRYDENKQDIIDAHDALCEQSTNEDKRISDIELALCELSELILSTKISE